MYHALKETECTPKYTHHHILELEEEDIQSIMIDYSVCVPIFTELARVSMTDYMKLVIKET